MATRKIPHNPVAANTLFHFTSSIDNIENILKNEFLPKYCLEDWSDIATNISPQAFPMICFCDIPLSQIRNHISKYGGYGIGLKKEWGLQNGITPVLYIHKKSKTLIALNLQTRTIVEQILKMADTTVNEKEKINRKLFNKQLKPIFDQLANQTNLKQYFKPYKGRIWEKAKQKFNKKADFYEEREWRYIPNIDYKKEKLGKILGETEFCNNSIRKIVETKLEKFKLSFAPKDIKYIIVNKEEEIPKMIEKIKDIKSPKYEDKDIQLLITRIISMEHILADF